jgi:hypothetical protein
MAACPEPGAEDTAAVQGKAGKEIEYTDGEIDYSQVYGDGKRRRRFFPK